MIIILAKNYPYGTILSGVWEKLLKLPNRKQKIRFRDVTINTGRSVTSLPYAEMYANYTMGDFIENHGYNAETIVGHRITFRNQEKFGTGFNGEPYLLKTFFQPIAIDEVIK